MALSDNQVASYRFENGANLGLDSIGANHLTNNNAATQAAGKVGAALALASASSQYLSVASNAALQLAGTAWEIACWVYPAALTTDRWVLGKGDDNAGYEYALFWDHVTSKFLGLTNTSGGLRLIWAQTTATTLNQWYFLNFWSDPTLNAGAGGISLVQDNAGGANATQSGDVVNAANAFALGARSDGSANWNGRIDEVNVWKRLLTTGERSLLFNAGSRRRHTSCSY